jgi:hypothetical protein
LLAPVDVSQKHGFVTRTLPDYSYASSLRNRADLCIARRRLAKAITVYQYGPMYVRGLSFAFSLNNSLAGKLNEGQGIAAARLEQDHMKVDITAASFQQAADQYPIAALALSLASQEDATALRYERAAAACHPTCGTAPYTPPRYLR